LRVVEGLGIPQVRGGTLQSMEGTPNTESRGSSLLMKALAVAVLLVVAWIAIKVIIGIVSSIFWIVLAIVVVVAVIWAVATLRS
jgi:fatty acid desaturase